MSLRIYYGGTFDPVHLGHLAIARAARDELQVAVRLLPAADPPHRAPPGATAEQRCRMLSLAIGDEPGLLLDRRELERAKRFPGRPSYTVDTLRELRAELGPSRPLAWLVGADSLLALPAWHEWQALFDLAHFIVAERPGSPLQDSVDGALGQALDGRWADNEQALFASPSGRVLRLHHPLRSESASAVRAQIAATGPWRALLPPAVADYVVDHGLYRPATP
ncbi:nicotinic acid mononucleotide adenylyltransferase [Stenotrophomonas sp. ZAC14D2_NAIMI4_7]|uniref:nicotinate-nucleotide adenylyltransferase n=1 Tax=Stenotrophomonas sp. ZAC14D2_NAIMI4_7 TaxID=2072405 RepID=UPI000D53E54C|nr:nicotinate-nucleotide adenylyltransferase [Stenotrophomonas sp. ZAC14D2_NAIMI4_7]AWH18679.1 nicotinic acid mononucleotide adenylyltransferase [Stenotrophomonas sp. ZAC14D2_NAIMI4_7]